MRGRISWGGHSRGVPLYFRYSKTCFEWPPSSPMRNDLSWKTDDGCQICFFSTNWPLMYDCLEDMTNGRPKVMQLLPMSDRLQWVIILVSNSNKKFPSSFLILHCDSSAKYEMTREIPGCVHDVWSKWAHITLWSNISVKTSWSHLVPLVYLPNDMICER